MVQQSVINAKSQQRKHNSGASVWNRVGQRAEQSAGRAKRRVADWLAHEDEVTLADGQVMIVPRANLAAAKELLAAQRAAERRVAAQLAKRQAAQFAMQAPDSDNEDESADARTGELVGAR